jgi:DNA-binding IclR family transcriptional regulator
MPSPQSQAPEGTQSVQRAAALLRIIASHNRAGLRVVDLCKLTGFRRPTLHRLLQCLAHENLVARNPRTRNYHLGPMLYELGLSAAPSVRLSDIARPHLRALADATGDMVFLTQRSGMDTVCIDRQEGAFWIRTYTLEIGTRRPLGIGAGSLAILSALPEEEIRAALEANRDRLHAYNGLTVRKLMTMVRQARLRGFAVHDGSVSGARAIGVAIRHAHGTPIAGISVSAVTSRMAEARWPELLKLLSANVAAVEAALDNAT